MRLLEIDIIFLSSLPVAQRNFCSCARAPLADRLSLSRITTTLNKLTSMFMFDLQNLDAMIVLLADVD